MAFECVITNLDLEKKEGVNVNKKEWVFLSNAAKAFRIILTLGIRHTNETKKKLCVDEIKCSQKGHTAKW